MSGLRPFNYIIRGFFYEDLRATPPILGLTPRNFLGNQDKTSMKKRGVSPVIFVEKSDVRATPLCLYNQGLFLQRFEGYAPDFGTNAP